MIRDLTKRYGTLTVLDGFSYTFGPGVTFVTGPSGCGKTTLLRLIAGLEKPDEGTIEGVPEKVAFVFQEDRLIPTADAVDNVRLVTGDTVSREEIEERLASLGLGDALKKPVSELSGGMRRRVAIARALCFGGDLLLLDEPFKGLDAPLRQSTAGALLEHAEGKTVIAVTHDPEEIGLMGGRELKLVP